MSSVIDQTESVGSVEQKVEKIPVAVLGATGSVGQRFVQLLEQHPWFRLHEVVASERSAGKRYADAAEWRLETVLPASAAAMEVRPLYAELESPIVFSGLDSSVAGEAEDHYADRGAVVVSNSKNHRLDPDVPLLIPEINDSHLSAIDKQRARRGGRGFIVTNPNCSTIGIAMALAPLQRAFGVDTLHVTTMQAISGAGFAGVASYSILDNVVPFISGEEEKIEREPLRILGEWNDGFEDAQIRISAQTNRVPVIDGHMCCMSLSLSRKPSGDLLAAVHQELESWIGEPQRLGLPTAPLRPLAVLDDKDRPQPRLDRDRSRGMAVSVGRIRECTVLDVRMIALVHNTIRGAAGAAILNAELLRAKGYV